MTLLLLAFLVAARLLDAGRIPDREIRLVQTVDEVAMPAPPSIQALTTWSSTWLMVSL